MLTMWRAIRCALSSAMDPGRLIVISCALSDLITDPIDMKSPNVAAEPAMLLRLLSRSELWSNVGLNPGVRFDELMWCWRWDSVKIGLGGRAGWSSIGGEEFLRDLGGGGAGGRKTEDARLRDGGGGGGTGRKWSGPGLPGLLGPPVMAASKNCVALSAETASDRASGDDTRGWVPKGSGDEDPLSLVGGMLYWFLMDFDTLPVRFGAKGTTGGSSLSGDPPLTCKVGTLDGVPCIETLSMVTFRKWLIESCMSLRFISSGGGSMMTWSENLTFLPDLFFFFGDSDGLSPVRMNCVKESRSSLFGDWLIKAADDSSIELVSELSVLSISSFNLLRAMMDTGVGIVAGTLINDLLSTFPSNA
ncbi:hypothetical protein OGAPHI_004410 [Ogataea philodendri]|uniref:Uncharacterized protein n=1 Tax=Ogataea philodendri TaxID=1378263 RepID=A0A9P8P703_9ASCO|nr:uncharacterized protein OGAPHI_004410 [Ogataea philodendri]KAH3666221.1 hypothetical protein OGAPHI_004410 [Ogataea philodendri]